MAETYFRNTAYLRRQRAESRASAWDKAEVPYDLAAGSPLPLFRVVGVLRFGGVWPSTAVFRTSYESMHTSASVDESSFGRSSRLLRRRDVKKARKRRPAFGGYEFVPGGTFRARPAAMLGLYGVCRITRHRVYGVVGTKQVALSLSSHGKRHD